MGKALDQTLNDLLRAVGIRCDLVAHLDDGTPVLRRQVLVRRLCCGTVSPEGGITAEDRLTYRRHRRKAQRLPHGTWR
jgi:sulfur carrier protein ThiS